jgi:hypothetical protein
MNNIQGIFDIQSRILTMLDGRAFRVSEAIASLDEGIRLDKVVELARKKNLLAENAIIAEL